MLAFASTVNLDFGPRRDPRHISVRSQTTEICFGMGYPLRREERCD
jgi:hypothetical protein